MGYCCAVIHAWVFRENSLSILSLEVKKDSEKIKIGTEFFSVPIEFVRGG
jgi:hypothetical protein